jgi:ribosomal protein S8E
VAFGALNAKRARNDRAKLTAVRVKRHTFVSGERKIRAMMFAGSNVWEFQSGKKCFTALAYLHKMEEGEDKLIQK